MSMAVVVRDALAFASAYAACRSESSTCGVILIPAGGKCTMDWGILL